MAKLKNSGVHRLAVFTSCCTLLLLMAGALVTSNDAGLAVPDWPLSYGSLMPPMVGGIRLEHSHRLMAAFVGILTITLTAWLWRVEPRRWVRHLGVAALGLIVAQGALGGITVLFLLPPAVSSAHATLAQLFFVTMISLAFFTSEWWQSEQPRLEDSSWPQLRALSVWTSLAILVQLVLGAAFRHGAFGIWPHLAGAVVVTILVVGTGQAVRGRFGGVGTLRAWGIWLQSLLGAQLLLGGAAYWVTVASRDTVQPLPLFVVVTVAHVLIGALTLAASVSLMLCAFRLIRPSEAMQSRPRVEQVAL